MTRSCKRRRKHPNLAVCPLVAVSTRQTPFFFLHWQSCQPRCWLPSLQPAVQPSPIINPVHTSPLAIGFGCSASSQRRCFRFACSLSFPRGILCSCGIQETASGEIRGGVSGEIAWADMKCLEASRDPVLGRPMLRVCLIRFLLA